MSGGTDFEVMRARDKRSGHFCAVPAGYNTERSDSSVLTWRGERFCIGHFQVECSIFYWAPEEVSVFAAIRNFLSVLIGELDEVSEHGRDQVSMMGVGRRQPGGI